MRLRNNVVVLLALLTAAGGCEAPVRAPEWGGVIDTLENGVIAVRNPSEGLWQPEDGWTLTEVLRIGAVEGDGPDLFGQISSLEVDLRGRIWVYDGQAHEIRVFDGDGHFVRVIGREGDGPGEFRGAAALTLTPSGDVWVIDPQAGRISEIDTAGVFTLSHRLSAFHTRYPWAGLVDDRGYYFDVARRTSDGAEVVVEYTQELEPVDTFLVPEYPGGPNTFVDRSETGSTSVRIPFAGQLYWDLAPNHRMWTLQTDEYVLVERTLEGDTLRIVSKPFDPIPVTGEEVEAALERLQWFEGRIDRSRIPNIRPPTVWFLRDDLDFTWVLQAARENPPSIQRWDVFSPEGVYQGEVTLPFDLVWGIPPVFRDGHLIGVVRDDLGVPFIVKASINRGPNDR